ncbi:hypothetical protein [Pedococcus bigeumensis]|uniref:Uncharacterized protein n=1 Tax=Pedococcus bigeumensis TaxID=433644 RepID=A0A502CMI3_9MICO|nr:hypothetical protein [Pedococcus bigeumensis]TPG13982.1 hypothetical protein EAH86_17370 [Pedococcus bigeumensis]
MSTNTSVRRIAAAAGATGFIALCLAAPASARTDPGTGGLHEQYPTVVATRPATTPITQVLKIDDNAVELLQLGAGVAAGLALGGAGMVLITRRSHSHPSPA